MKKIIFTIIAALLGGLALFGQSRGRVVDGEGLPIEFATVALFNADSLVVDAATTDTDGVFILEKAARGSKARLFVSLVGYLPYEETLTVGEDLGTVALAEDAVALEGAKVTEKKALIEQKIDKIIFNVSEAVTAQGTTADEMLKKAPGVSVDKDGNVKLNGQSVAVWIDNRPSQMSGEDLMAILKGMDSGNIENIEIMAHPSSKYDAQGGGGIVNIILKKQKITGLNGSVAVHHEGWVYSKEYLQSSGVNLNMNYRGKSSNSTLTFSPSIDNDRSDISNNTVLRDDAGNVVREIESGNISRSLSHRENLRFAHDQYIGEKDIVGVIVSGSIYQSRDRSALAENWTLQKAGGLDVMQRSQALNTAFLPNVQGNLNYTHTFEKARAEEITVDLNYGFYKRDKYNKMYSPFYMADGSACPGPAWVPDPSRSPETFFSDGRQNINIWSAKVDYQRLLAGRFMFEAGGKYSATRTNNNTRREDALYAGSDSSWVFNPGFSSNFIYTEQIGALYANVASAFFQGKFTMKVGLRGEYTNSLGEWLSEKKATRRSYFNLFPTAYLGYNPSLEHRLSLSYSRRITRPGFYELNPQFTYYNAVSGQVGDPNLKPAFNHDLSFSYGFKTWLNIAAVYNYTRDNIIQDPYNDFELGVSGFKWANSGTNHIAGLNVSISELPFTKWWVFNANLFNAYVRSVGPSYLTQSWMMMAYGQFTFILPASWKIETGVWASKGMEINQMSIAPSVYLWAGVKKDFLDGKATLSIFMNNIVDSGMDVKTISPVTSIDMHQRWNGRRLNISFRYRFGKAQTTKYRRVGMLEESSRVGGSSSDSAGAGAGGSMAGGMGR